MKVFETAVRRQNRPYRLYARATKLQLIPRGLAVCKTLANKHQSLAAARRHSRSWTSLGRLCFSLFSSTKVCSDGKQDPIIRLHGSLTQARMRMAPPNAIGATAALI